MEYSIKEVSEKFKLSAHTLRFYEKEGVLPTIQRDESGRRVYSNKDLGIIQIICCMRVTGMSLEYIKKYVELCILGDNTIPERHQMILSQKEIIEDLIKEYQDLLNVVNWKLQYYDNRMHENNSTAIN
ncbi:putative transcriptional regulator [Desulfosporosinus acidiphilus SJ4]|uniref:Putative transcriptional regulator n=1 Tax=Desulfosporosinus acidiphilus (strain DSM 22704 / JCM 16185 / SJ4) TaxID=646529 RepID=I4DC68_DESAJ|nr:MerR family transcriptional regulator [Desulfosporosinus acidiphilus]AFM43392.1 putative transcriptional regulator [Desulfosporosinus acidiphilus SJ4]